MAGGVLETTANTKPAAVSAAERDYGQVPNDTHVPSNVPAVSAKGDPQDVECVVCWEAEAGVVFQPCGHACTCMSCAESFLASGVCCPMCRAQITAGVAV